MELKPKAWVIVLSVLGAIYAINGDISDNYEYYGYESPAWHSPRSQSHALAKTDGLSPLGIAMALSVSIISSKCLKCRYNISNFRSWHVLA